MKSFKVLSEYLKRKLAPETILFILGILCYIALLTVNLDGSPIMGDEALFFNHSFNVGQNLFNDSISLIQKVLAILGHGRMVRSQPPLVYLIQGFSIMVAMFFSLPSEVGIRIPTIIAYSSTIGLTYWWTRRQHGWRYSFLLSIVLAFSPFFFHYARDGHVNALASPFLLIAFICLAGTLRDTLAVEGIHEDEEKRRIRITKLLIPSIGLSTACLIASLSYLSAFVLAVSWAFVFLLLSKKNIVAKIFKTVRAMAIFAIFTAIVGAGWWLAYQQLALGIDFFSAYVGYIAGESNPDILMNFFVIRISQLLPLLPGNNPPSLLQGFCVDLIGGYARTYVFSPVVSNLVFWGVHIFVFLQARKKPDPFRLFALLVVDMHVIIMSTWAFNLWNLYMHFPSFIYVLLIGNILLEMLRILKERVRIDKVNLSGIVKKLRNPHTRVDALLLTLIVLIPLLYVGYSVCESSLEIMEVETVDDSVQLALNSKLDEYNIQIFILNNILHSDFEMQTYFRHPALAYANWAGRLVLVSQDNSTFKASLTMYQPYLDPPFVPDSLDWSYQPPLYPTYSFEGLVNGSLFKEFNVAIYSEVPWTLEDHLPTFENKYLYIFPKA